MTLILLYALIIMSYLLISFGLLHLAKFLKKDSKPANILSIESVNGKFVPVYLGYFFVALSIPNIEVFVLISVILLVFSCFSSTYYFNPVFLLFGYKFYSIADSQGRKIFIITKRQFQDITNVKFPELYRITDYTFIEFPAKD